MGKKTTYTILALAAFTAYCYIQKSNDQPKIWYVNRLPFGYNGLTIPPFGIFILKDQKQNAPLVLHELVHWKQFQREGLARFLIGYRRQHRAVGYDANPYEIEARFCENDFCKSNYTYCVREGLAKTITNKNFRT